MTPLRNLFEASSFDGDWYGWLTNQVSHIFLGLALVFVSCFLWLAAVGEFPYRLHTWLSLVTLYLAYEWAFQGWRWFDTVEDTLFVTFYGAGGALYTFHEVAPGSPKFTGNITHLLPFFYVAAAHLFAGAAARFFFGKSSSKE